MIQGTSISTRENVPGKMKADQFFHSRTIFTGKISPGDQYFHWKNGPGPKFQWQNLFSRYALFNTAQHVTYASIPTCTCMKKKLAPCAGECHMKPMFIHGHVLVAVLVVQMKWASSLGGVDFPPEDEGELGGVWNPGENHEHQLEVAARSQRNRPSVNESRHRTW